MDAYFDSAIIVLRRPFRTLGGGPGSRHPVAGQGPRSLRDGNA